MLILYEIKLQFLRELIEIVVIVVSPMYYSNKQ